MPVTKGLYVSLYRHSASEDFLAISGSNLQDLFLRFGMSATLK